MLGDAIVVVVRTLTSFNVARFGGCDVCARSRPDAFLVFFFSFHFDVAVGLAVCI